MTRNTTNPNVHFLIVDFADHFDILAPTNQLIAKKILRDLNPECNLVHQGRVEQAF